MNNEVPGIIGGVSGPVRVIAGVIELMAVFILVAAVAASAWLLIREAAGRELDASVARTRRQLGMRLVLALEFLIAADILKTVVAPSSDELVFLGGIILIRTVLSISIAWEIREGAASSGGRGEAERE